MAKLDYLFKRYLKLIGLKYVPKGIEGLNEIVRNHLYHIPFENISKLLLFEKEKGGRPVKLSEFLDNIEFQNLGGTCHNSNPYLKALLAFIGYKVHLLGADMDEPDVHTSIRAIVDSCQYHIDVGYAAPFTSPIPLDKTPHEIKQGQYSYLFQKNESLNKYEIKVMSDGQRIHGYSINEIPRQFSFFHKTIYESFQPGMTFMSCIRITRIFEDRTVELKNRTLFHHKNGKSHSVVLKNIREIETAVKNELLLPNCPIKKAISILESVTKKSFFDDDNYPEKY